MGTHVAVALAEALDGMPALQVLKLTGNHIPTYAMDRIVARLPPSITELFLGQNSAPSVKLLAQTMIALRNLRVLDLDVAYSIMDWGVVADALALCKHLEQLTVMSSYYILQGLPEQLRRLHLQGGVRQSELNLLHRLQQLQILELHVVSCDSNAALCVAELIRSLPHLTKLDMRAFLLDSTAANQAVLESAVLCHVAAPWLSGTAVKHLRLNRTLQQHLTRLACLVLASRRNQKVRRPCPTLPPELWFMIAAEFLPPKDHPRPALT